MSIWQKLGRFLSPDDTALDELFSLGDRLEPGIPGARHADLTDDQEVDPWLPEDPRQDGGSEQDKTDESRDGRRRKRRPVPVGAMRDGSDRDGATDGENGSGGSGQASASHRSAPGAGRVKSSRDKLDGSVVPDLTEMKRRLEELFHLPQNKDIVIREFFVGLHPPVPALAVFTDGLAGGDSVHHFVLQPLMRLVQLDEPGDEPLAQLVAKRLVPGSQTELIEGVKDVVYHVLAGDTVVFLDGSPLAVAVDTKGWSERSVGEPKAELTVIGPQDAFNENMRTNTALIRRRLHTPDLITEIMRMGDLSNNDVAMMFIHGITNPKLVAEVRRRLKAIKTDVLHSTGELQQFVEDSPTTLLSTAIRTERPDRAAAFLSEGSVVLIVNTTPFAYIVPVTLWAMIQSPEDGYLRWPYGTFLRWMRFAALFVTLLVPAMYVAVTNYHPEMIPTDLLLAIAAARERVPFPVVFEVLLMEGSFELIREAGIRVPSIIGPTLGIVGALILGQAAVAASIVSPILVIIVAITGLSSFAIPNYGLSMAIRLLRFVYIFLAATTGFFGIAIGLAFLVIHFVSVRSFGVPFLSPVAPNRPGSADLMSRRPAFNQEWRPLFLRPANRRRQPKLVRTWDPTTSGMRSRKGQMHDGQGEDGDQGDGGDGS